MGVPQKNFHFLSSIHSSSKIALFLPRWIQLAHTQQDAPDPDLDLAEDGRESLLSAAVLQGLECSVGADALLDDSCQKSGPADLGNGGDKDNGGSDSAVAQQIVPAQQQDTTVAAAAAAAAAAKPIATSTDRAKAGNAFFPTTRYTWTCGVCAFNDNTKARCLMCETRGEQWDCGGCETKNRVQDFKCKGCDRPLEAAVPAKVGETLPLAAGPFQSGTPVPLASAFGSALAAINTPFESATSPTPSPFGFAPVPAVAAFTSTSPSPWAGSVPVPLTFGFGFGQPQQFQEGTGNPPFIAVKIDEKVASKSGSVNSQAVTIQVITAMPEYAHKSVEELRYEDYKKGNKTAGGQAQGTSSNFGTGKSAQAASNLFAAAARPGGTAPSTNFGAAIEFACGSTCTNSHIGRKCLTCQQDFAVQGFWCHTCLDGFRGVFPEKAGTVAAATAAAATAPAIASQGFSSVGMFGSTQAASTPSTTLGTVLPIILGVDGGCSSTCNIAHVGNNCLLCGASYVMHARSGDGHGCANGARGRFPLTAAAAAAPTVATAAATATAAAPIPFQVRSAAGNETKPRRKVSTVPSKSQVDTRLSAAPIANPFTTTPSAPPPPLLPLPPPAVAPNTIQTMMLKQADITASAHPSDLPNILTLNKPACWSSETLLKGARQWIKLNVMNASSKGLEMFDLAIYIKNFGASSPQTVKVTLFPPLKDTQCARMGCPHVKSLTGTHCCGKCETGSALSTCHGLDCGSFCSPTCTSTHAGLNCIVCGKEWGLHLGGEGHKCPMQPPWAPRGRFVLKHDVAMRNLGLVLEKTVSCPKGPDGWFTLAV
jgi:hypothetical protein